MKEILVIAVVLFCYKGYSHGIEFNKSTFEEVLELAEKENKLIFMDCYTTWCAPCKVLTKEVFTQKKLANFSMKILLI